MAKGKTKPGARAPRTEHLIVRHRIEVVEALLARLQAIEPARTADLESEERDVAALPVEDAQRKAVADRRAARRGHASEVGALIRANLGLLLALEDQCLPDRGFVGQLLALYKSGYLPAPPEPLQAHMKPRRENSWQSSVLRCAAECPLAGAECIEPAILACIRMLRELRQLVDDDGAPTDDQRLVYDHRGHLRATARQFLLALDSPKNSLDAIARVVKRDGAHVRRFSAPLQRLGLIRARADNTWERTPEGTLVLRAT